MPDNTLQKDTKWLVSYVGVLVLLYVSATFNMFILMTSRCRERRMFPGSSRILWMRYPRAFICLCCGTCLATIVPTTVLCALGFFEPSFRLYVMSLGLYSSLSSEVCLVTARFDSLTDHLSGISGFAFGIRKIYS
jgi:hypothetical protein